MNALLLSFALAGSVTADPESPKPASPEQIQAWLKTIQEPTRHRDDKEGPPAGIPPLFGFRFHTAEIRRLAMAGEAARPAVLALLADESRPGQARANAALVAVVWLLGKGAQQPLDTEILNTLKAALKDKDKSLRWATLEGLEPFGAAWVIEDFPLRQKGIPTVKLDRDSMHLSVGAMDGLLPEVIALVADEEPEIASEAAAVLATFGRPNRGVKELLAALGRPEKRVRACAVRALSRVGVDDPVSLKAILGQLKPERYGDYYVTVVQSVGRFGPRAKDAVPELIRVIESSEWKRQQSTYLYDVAITSLGEIGPDAKSAVLSILKYAQYCPTSEGSMLNLIEALDKIDPQAGRQGRAVYDRLKDEKNLREPPLRR